MANNNANRCRCRGGAGCLRSVRGWGNGVYYGRWCPDADTNADCHEDCRESGERCDRRGGRDRCGFRWEGESDVVAGIFTAATPMAVAANGVIPMAENYCNRDMTVNGGLVTLNASGTYLATVTARVPEGTELDTTLTLNANDASQYPAILMLSGAGPSSATSQAIFEVCDRTVVSLRTSAAISMTEALPQPLFTLSLVRID